MSARNQCPLIAAGLVICFLGRPALASYDDTGLDGPPDIRPIDVNSVELVSLKASFSVEALSIGDSARLLTHEMHSNDHTMQRYFDNLYVRHKYIPKVAQTQPTRINISVGQRSAVFRKENGVWVPDTVRGDTLHQGTSSFAWTLADGTVFETEKGAGVIGRLISAQYPNGLYKRVYRDSNGYITSVVQNDGYMLKFAYPSSGVTTVTAINMAVDYCPRSTLAPCAFSRSWPTATISDGNPFVVINSTGATWELQSDWNLNSSSYLTLKPFTADTSTHVYELRNYKIYNGQTWQIVANDLVYAVSTPWGDWSYGRSPNGSYNYKSNSHSPQNTVRQVDYDSNGDINRIKQPDGRMVHYHPVTGLISSSTYPSISYEYDSRGNLTRVTSGDMITQAGYPPSCPSYARKTCNKPDWVTDARGVKTAFNYVITHGGRNYMIEDSLNKRRMTAYRWVQKHAWVKNASGSYSKLDVDGPRAVWLLESVRTCRQSLMHSSGQFCHGGGDILTSYDYGSGNSSAPSNLHVRGEVVTAGGQSLRTCYKYDDLGNRISETAPRANLASCP